MPDVTQHDELPPGPPEPEVTDAQGHSFEELRERNKAREEAMQAARAEARTKIEAEAASKSELNNKALQMQQEASAAQARTAALPRQEFSAKVKTDKGILEVTYVYDFNELDIEQLLLAKSVFEFANQQARKPARSLAEHEQAAQMDALAVGLSYLFVLKDPDGNLVPFDRKTNRVEAYQFIKRLKSPQWPRLKQVKENFFLKANVVDYALLMQSLPLVETFASQTLNLNGSSNSESTLSDSQDSTPGESLSEDSAS